MKGNNKLKRRFVDYKIMCTGVGDNYELYGTAYKYTQFLFKSF